MLVEWGKIVAEISLPLAIIIVALLYRQAVTEWLKTASEVSIGPFELKRLATVGEKILKDTSRLQIMIAEGRVIEAEVFLSYPLLSAEQAEQMRRNIENLKNEIRKLEQHQN